MKIRNRIAACLSIIGISAFAVGAFAQDQTFGLSEEDFTAFGEALSASTEFDTLTYDFTLNAALGADTGVNLSGSGVIDAQSAGGLTLEVTGDLFSGGETTPAALGVVALGDEFYVRLGDETQPYMTAESLQQQLMGMAGGMGMGSDMTEEDANAMLGDLMSNPALAEAMTSLGNFDATQYIGIERGGDTFVTTLSLGEALADENLSAALGSLSTLGMSAMGGGMGSTTEMSPEQMQQMGAALAQTFADSAITLTQTVDPATNRVSVADLVIDIPMGGSSPVNVAFTINLTYDEPVTITAPENIMSSEDMGGMMEGMATPEVTPGS